MAFDKDSYDNDYKRQNYDRVTVLLPKGRAKDLKAYAAAQGKSMGAVIIEAVENYCKLNLSKRDGE